MCMRLPKSAAEQGDFRGLSATSPLPKNHQREKGRPFAMQNVLITGGAGYVGHLLTPRLLSEGYHVTVYDQLYFGCRLPNSPDMKVIQGDIRDTPKLAEALVGQDAVLHLAGISNDASFRSDERRVGTDRPHHQTGTSESPRDER